MKLIRDSSKIVKDQISDYVHKVCLDQLLGEQLHLDSNILIQGLIAVSVNQHDVFVIHINNNLQTKAAELPVACKKKPLEPDIVSLSDEDDNSIDGDLTSTDGLKYNVNDLLQHVELKDSNGSEICQAPSDVISLPDSTEKENQALKEKVNGEISFGKSQESIRQDLPKQPGLTNDADISIVRHHQRRKRTYTNSAMSIKREPQDSRHHQRKLDLSPNYLTAAEIEHFDNLISPDKNVLDMSFNAELVADLGCIDLEDSLGEISSQTDRSHHISQYTCSQCGIGCTSAEHLDKHQLLHLPFSVVSVTGDIDIDLTDCHDDDSLIGPITSSGTSDILMEHFDAVAPSRLVDNHMPECDRTEIESTIAVSDDGDKSSDKSNSDDKSVRSEEVLSETTIINTDTEQELPAANASLINDTDMNINDLSHTDLSQTDLNQTDLNQTDLNQTDLNTTDLLLNSTLESNPESNPKRKAKNTECPTCGKNFQRMQHLNEHVLTHTREKPHKCPDCRKCYRLKSHLKRHIQKCH